MAYILTRSESDAIRKKVKHEIENNPSIITSHDVWLDMQLAAVTMFPDVSMPMAVAQFLKTKQGGALYALYEKSPAAEQAVELPPPLRATNAEKKMNALAGELVTKGEAKTHAHAIVRVLEQYPALYTDYLNEVAASEG